MEVIDKAKIQCSTIYSESENSDVKCIWTGRVRDLEKHLLQCPFNLVACPYEGYPY